MMSTPSIVRVAMTSLCLPALSFATSLHAQASSTGRKTAADTVALTEWDVPWGAATRPRDPSIDPQGRVWFVGQEGNYVARFDPASKKFERFEIDPGTNPHTVNVDPTGDAWYAGNRNGMIGRIDGKTGKITRYPMPEAAAKDPHTITFTPKGDLWFTLQNSNMVGFLDKQTGAVKVIAMPTPRSRPYGIVLDKSGRPWFNLFGTNKLGTIDPTSMRVREYVLPDERARGRRIALTTDGAVWYGDYSRGYVGRLDPVSGAVKEWPLPGGATSLPYAMTVDDADRLWLVETGRQPNRLVAFDPRSNSFVTQVDLGPAAPNTVRHMVFDKNTRTIWFGSDRGTIGRATVPATSRKPIG
ncbi:lyase [Gemmatimonas sp.]|jgi:virginiamycin B lyase|uniref:Vgb family protein n=1 Tax=Gemmatimonas sp. TaxID=1962908 RepID=UPI0037BF43EE